MADNVAITAGSGTTIAADDVGGGVLHQRVKVTWGPDGTGNDADVASGKPLPVQLRGSDGTDVSNGRNLIYQTGTNGFIDTLTLTSGSDLASLASGSAVTLTGGGAAGVSTQTDTSSGKYGYVEFKTATAGFTPTAGGCISIWWLSALDGTNYETTPATPSTTVPALPRAPDCIIPLDAAALGTSAIKISPRCKLPEQKFKVLVQNNSGAAFGAGNYVLTLYVAAEKN